MYVLSRRVHVRVYKSMHVRLCRFTDVCGECMAVAMLYKVYAIEIVDHELIIVAHVS